MRIVFFLSFPNNVDLNSIFNLPTDNGEELFLILKLTELAHTLAPFCPEAPERYAKIVFSKNCILPVLAVLLKHYYTTALFRCCHNLSSFVSSGISKL